MNISSTAYLVIQVSNPVCVQLFISSAFNYQVATKSSVNLSKEKASFFDWELQML